MIEQSTLHGGGAPRQARRLTHILCFGGTSTSMCVGRLTHILCFGGTSTSMCVGDDTGGGVRAGEQGWEQAVCCYAEELPLALRCGAVLWPKRFGGRVFSRCRRRAALHDPVLFD